MRPRPTAIENQLLRAIAPIDQLGLDQYLEPFELIPGDVLFEPGDPIDMLYFPCTGQVSLLVLDNEGAELVSAAVGKEGVLGLGGLMSGDVSFTRQRVQIGGEAYSLPRKPFLAHTATNIQMRQVIEVHRDAFTAQLLQSVFCQGMHRIGERTARWLLTAFDAVHDSDLELTQDMLANVLGVRRPTVTTFLNSDVMARLVRVERGRLALVDREGLTALACSCYSIIRTVHQQAAQRRSV